MTSIHCLAHRLNLASSQAADEVPFLKKFQSTLTDLFRYFHQSTVRTSSLQAIQKVLDLPDIKIKEVYEVRWLAFYSALHAVFKSWPALVRYFRDKAEEQELKALKREQKEKEKKQREIEKNEKAKSRKNDKTTRKSVDGAKTVEQDKSKKEDKDKSVDGAKTVEQDKSKNNDKDKSVDGAKAVEQDKSKKKDKNKSDGGAKAIEQGKTKKGKDNTDESEKASEAVKPREKTREENLYEMLASYQFVYALHFLMDVIPKVGELNLILQKTDLDVAAIHPAVSGLLDTIAKVQKGNSYYMNEFKQKGTKKDEKLFVGEVPILYSSNAREESRDARSAFCNALEKKIRERFPNSSWMRKFSYMGMRPISFLGQDELQAYGVAEVGALADFYGTPKVGKGDLGELPPLVNSEEAKLEWQIVKQLVLDQRYPRANTNELWKTINNFHSPTCPNVITLAKICLVLPLHTSDVERAFSVQNQVKTAIRNRISGDSVNKYLLVGIEGPPIEVFPWQQAANHWRKEKERKLYK